ncbi:major capsid protein [Pararhodospirillum photometricum]|nr:major capsid protein [Pararhodospirillum photometricum]
MPQQFPFPVDNQLTPIVMAFKNRRMIADEALPRFPVAGMNYRYSEYDLSQGLTIPETAVGRRARPNKVVFTASERNGATTDHALDDEVPQADVDNAPAAQKNLIARTSERLANLIALRREIRVAEKLFDESSYPAANKTTLSGAAQFSDAASDPIGLLTDIMDGMIYRPNVMVFGRRAFTKFARHPAVVKAINHTSGDSGFVRQQDVAALFELDRVLVGEAFVNIARKGQTPELQRAWGPHIALYFLDDLGGPSESPSFGFTAQFGARLAGQWPDKNIGMRGGTVVRVGESVEEVIAAPSLGYFIENAIADD